MEKKPEIKVHKQKSVLKFLRRRFWIFCIERGVYEVGLSSLTWSCSKISKVIEYAAKSEYTNLIVLDTKTGNYLSVDEDMKVIQLSLADIIRKNQKEFELLHKKFN